MKASLAEALWRRVAAGVLACALCVCAAAQVSSGTQGIASVSGRVTDGERGLPGVVVAMFVSEGSRSLRFATRARTDSEGRYRFDGLRPGRYQVVPYAPAHVPEVQREGWAGSKHLNLLAGDAVEDVDFRLSKGGVITGRVTNADGQPVIRETVNFSPLDSPTGQGPRFVGSQMRVQTDDRGIYRAYGLAPGRYHVSVGVGSGFSSYGRSQRQYRLTYHPNAPDAARAAVVEVSAGSEVEEVDITLGRPIKTYRAAGRVVSAETGQPVAGVRVGVSQLDPTSRHMMGYVTGRPTGARGEFSAEDLVPGRYAAIMTGGPDGSDLYSDPLVFEVGRADVTGLELKLKRGASVSGVVQIEGVRDRATLARLLRQVRVYAFTEQGGDGRGGPFGAHRPHVVAPHSGETFHLTGLRPGRLRIEAEINTPNLALSRIEAGGANVREQGLELAEGAQVTGVRLLLIYGTGVLSGQLVLEGGSLPANLRSSVMVRRVGAETPVERLATPDARGRFQIEGLPAGTYSVSGRGFSLDRREQPFMFLPQQVYVAEGAEQQITLVIQPPPPRNRPPAIQPPAGNP
jgi:hypothetical protein